MSDNMVKIIDEKGNEKEIEVLANIQLDNDDRNYVIYTENQETQLGNVQVFISEIKENEYDIDLIAIDDEKVWNEIKKKVSQMLKGV